MTDWYAKATLPKYNRPPVVETAMAIEFAPIDGFDFFKLTKLQGEWDSRYPDISDMPGAPPTNLNPAEFQVSFGSPPRRLWAAAPSNGQLIQSQSDRLILNWRKDFTADPYPGYYAHLRGEYEVIWGELRSFIQRNDLTAPRALLAEFNYINAVPLNDGDSLSDVVTVVRAPEHELPGRDKFARFQFVRDIDESDEHPFAAQLLITGEPQELEPGLRQLVFTVVAKVLLGDRSDDPLAGLDAAHALASQTFARIVTDPKQEQWERTQ